jgi:acetylornithine aminotransferase
MCAIDLADPRAGDVTAAMLDQGYLVNNTSAHTVRFLPPLVIDPEDIAGLLGALRTVLAA